MRVIADFQTSTATSKQNEIPFLSTFTSSAHVIDLRRYQNFENSAWRSGRNNEPGRRCFLCKKFNCWYIKHSKEKHSWALQNSSRLRAFVIEAYNREEEPNTDGEFEKMNQLEELAINIAHEAIQDEHESNDQEGDDHKSSVDIKVTHTAHKAILRINL